MATDNPYQSAETETKPKAIDGPVKSGTGAFIIRGVLIGFSIGATIFVFRCFVEGFFPLHLVRDIPAGAGVGLIIGTAWGTLRRVRIGTIE